VVGKDTGRDHEECAGCAKDDDTDIMLSQLCAPSQIPAAGFSPFKIAGLLVRIG
jgi:hypothetical protein